MKEFLEGSMAVARAVALCKPGVISAYPITPQTHIVE
jgi:pyruvate ferredoxin oxidoreductase alpha subunit